MRTEPMSNRLFLAAALVGLVGLLLSACTTTPPANDSASPPNIVMFISDDHGRLDSSVYGSSVAKTPAMADMAQAGMTFSHAFIASPTCAPSRAALYSGLYPQNNGVEGNHDYEWFDGVTSLIHDFTARGYEVAAFGKVAHGYNDKRKTWDHGFTHVGRTLLDMEQVESFLAERDSSRPLLLFVGTRHPHVPWTREPARYAPAAVDLPPKSFSSPQTLVNRAQYLEDVSKMDDLLGQTRTLAAQYLGDNTLTLFTSDHGAQWPFAKWNLYDAGARVALIAEWPGRIAAGANTDAMVSWIDILPTFLDAAGTQASGARDGQSFLGVLLGETDAHRDIIYASHTGDGNMNVYPIRLARSRDWAYIRNIQPDYRHRTHIDGAGDKWTNEFWKDWARAAAAGDEDAAEIVTAYQQRPAEELFYIPDDPHQLNNLAGDPAAAAALARLRGEVDAYIAETGDRLIDSGEPILLREHPPLTPGPAIN